MLKLYKPEYSDLWFRQKMLEDEETMSYNHAWGGTIPFPEERWNAWYDRWIVNSEGKRFYRYLADEKGNFVGEIAFHFDEERDIYLANVIIFSGERRKGYGSEGLRLLCSAAKDNGVVAIYDDIAIDNPAVKMFLAQGFAEEFRTEEIIMLKKEL